MNVTLETHLQTIRNCDAKNLSNIINEYSHYTELEELFHQAIVERSLKTGYEDSKRYVDEAQILEFFRKNYVLSYSLLFSIEGGKEETSFLLSNGLVFIMYQSILEFWKNIPNWVI